MNEVPVSAGLVVFIIAVVTFLSGMWWRVEKAIENAKIAALMRADTAAALASMVQAQLAEHRLHVAENYITKAGMRETKDEIIAVVTGVKLSVDQMNQRMDRVIESTRHPLKSVRSEP